MKSSTLSSIYRFASIAPLIASLIAPFAVLLDIPALTVGNFFLVDSLNMMPAVITLQENWYTRNREPQPDPHASLILSGLSLGSSVVANALLVMRFSFTSDGWIMATRLSVVCWAVRVVTGVINLVVFGALTRNEPEFSYAEGFWCAVVSAIASGIILLLLLFHWAVEFKREVHKDIPPPKPVQTRLEIRVAGRHFMLQNTSLVALIALTSLILSRIEKWTYVQGIYFTMVTFLTVGFGDFRPTKPSTKILLFPLAFLGIALLASCINMISSFFSNHQREHKARLRAEREKEWQKLQMMLEEHSLNKEVVFLTMLHEQRGWREQGLALVQSLAGFIAFWLVGAVIFHAAELPPLQVAESFSLCTQSSRPIMTALAVQAISHIIESTSEKRMGRRRNYMVESAGSPSETPALTDPENIPAENGVDELHSALIRRHLARKAAEGGNAQVTVCAGDLEELVEHAVELERTARQLLIAHLGEGTPAEILLRADWNLQLRSLEALKLKMGCRNSRSPSAHNDGRLKSTKRRADGMVETVAGATGELEGHEEEQEIEIVQTALGGMNEDETLQRTREFRSHVAGVLAMGSRLRRLEGFEKYMFERRREEAEEQLQG
ncbi:Outward-rectifier potassium channel TOK1 [Ceratobasidium theobromae]|uniref:Outward-rectifier potassium channel TOK1 n=1 Tax=Ceratobasidium theobromae TaxID=1582974 RepID=A0A5N5QDT8_9AGAM|nr:Outward-rectifier potassium channel TOK1 [Ceratobasidium theobromae]